MSQKPLIVVCGATGAQGGSVANSLLATGNYKVRALTRNPDSNKAKALASKGAEVFKCDLSVEEDVKNALKGADIAWVVTNFLDPSIFGKDPYEEERIGKMIADIAKEVGLNWLIYSSLPDTTAGSGGKYPNIIEFVGKNRVEQHIKKLGLPNATFVYVCFYNQNFGTIIPFIPNENGEIDLTIPYLEEDDSILLIDVENDLGPIVAKVIEEGPAKWNDRKVLAASDTVTFKDIIDVFTKVTGKTHKLKTMTDEDIAGSFFDNESLKEMFKWFKEFGTTGEGSEIKDVALSKKLHPKIRTFEQYVVETYGNKA
ncbi:hypothetical protein RclHR1_01480023 [Rhizophagus clarus]|uniref:NmrA-like family domain-containing protein 1 n=1 Tax=Rhizophagus clarus TaxID=94130 RepID=A0A2Z6R6C2_9GLOM|nr:hypothetical protein RclHR1_01480023 [Rhizophagus clarus]GET00873.1 NmrA-like family domain-containing protein 1 [Rhizophagus clarus]